jgi:hypothetical protein
VKLELDAWAEGVRGSVTVDAPDGTDLNRQIERLDQRRHTELTLFGTDGQYLVIGGGRGRYHVYIASTEHDDRAILQSAEHQTGTEELVIDGRTVEVPARSLVTLDEAFSAAHAFLHSGGPDTTRRWSFH